MRERAEGAEEAGPWEAVAEDLGAADFQEADTAVGPLAAEADGAEDDIKMLTGNTSRSKIAVAAFCSFLSLGLTVPAWATTDSPPKDQQTFATPQDAVQTLIKACQKDNTKGLLKLFGSDSKDIVESGDRRQDKEDRTKFASLATQKNALIPDPMNPDRTILSIGPDDWPFPVPLVRSSGRWYFGTPDGSQEILARRVGSNEMHAIEVCRGYVEAQYEYAQDHRKSGIPQYAQHIVSSGTEQGLYWEPGPGEAEPNVPRGFAKAAAGMGAAEREPYHGYFYKVLKAQGPDARGGKIDYVVNGDMIGGFALVAWPAEYGVSGIQTFLVNHDGTVFEKHLGPDTSKLAEQMTEFNPDKTWRPVQPEETPQTPTATP